MEQKGREQREIERKRLVHELALAYTSETMRRMEAEQFVLPDAALTLYKTFADAYDCFDDYVKTGAPDS